MNNNKIINKYSMRCFLIKLSKSWWAWNMLMFAIQYILLTCSQSVLNANLSFWFSRYYEVIILSKLQLYNEVERSHLKCIFVVLFRLVVLPESHTFQDLSILSLRFSLVHIRKLRSMEASSFSMMLHHLFLLLLQQTLKISQRDPFLSKSLLE